LRLIPLLAEICALPGHFLYLSPSLECLVDDANFLLKEKAVRYILDAWSFLLWWNILGKGGFILLSLGIGSDAGAPAIHHTNQREEKEIEQLDKPANLFDFLILPWY
jgi:hypothetical protein